MTTPMKQVYLRVAGSASILSTKIKEMTAEDYKAFLTAGRFEEASAEDFAKFEAAITEAEETAAKARGAKAAAKASATAKLIMNFTEQMSPEELGAFDIGFVNLHVSDDLDGKGDGLWYLFGVGKTRHEGDTIMTRSEAIAQGVKLGS